MFYSMTSRKQTNKQTTIKWPKIIITFACSIIWCALVKSVELSNKIYTLDAVPTNNPSVTVALRWRHKDILFTPYKTEIKDSNLSFIRNQVTFSRYKQMAGHTCTLPVDNCCSLDVNTKTSKGAKITLKEVIFHTKVRIFPYCPRNQNISWQSQKEVQYCAKVMRA